MKVSFVLENIIKKIPWVLRAITLRSDLPLVSSLLLETKKGEIKISATDLETGIIITCPANVAEEGKTAVSAKAFTDILGNLNEEAVVIETEGEKMILKTKKTRTTLQTFPTEEIPKIMEEKGESWLKLERKSVDKEIKRVVFAASPESERAEISGVLIRKKAGERTFVATDGYRLSLQVKKEVGGDLPAGRQEKEEREISVPAKLLKDQVGIREGDVELFFSEKTNQIVFETDGVLVVGRTIQAKFPDYEKILPTDFSTKTVFDRKEMQQAIKACSVFAREASNVIKFSIKKDKIVVAANAPTLGEGMVEVDAKTEGEENDIAFNARYLSELMSNIDDEEMVFEMTTPVAPGVFKVAGDDSFLHLIMPIRVQE